MPEILAELPVTIHSRFNRVAAIAVWVFAVCLAAGGLASSRASLDLVPLLAWISAAAYYLLWRPTLRVTDDGLQLVNVVRRIAIPWDALIHVDTKYALTLHTPGRTFSVWCAPAPGPAGALRAARTERERAGQAHETLVRPGDLPSTESGRAAGLVRQHWADKREAGILRIGQASDAPPVVSWDIPGLLVLTAGLGIAVGALAVL